VQLNNKNFGLAILRLVERSITGADIGVGHQSQETGG